MPEFKDCIGAHLHLRFNIQGAVNRLRQKQHCSLVSKPKVASSVHKRPKVGAKGVEYETWVSRVTWQQLD